MRLGRLGLVVALGVAAGCGGSVESGGGSGGSSGGAGGGGGQGGGSPIVQLTTFHLSCEINPVVLNMPIELSFELDRPYTEGGSADVTFSASLTFDEQTATDLIEAGARTIDIIALEIATQVSGATPEVIGTMLAAAPINDFDLEGDPDDNGIAGPHRLDLETVVITTTAAGGADQVEFGLRFDGISLILGEFNVPEDCFNASLVGISASFSVD